MRNFKEAYREAVDNLELPDITAEQIRTEGYRKKMVTYRRQRRFVAAASAACVFLLCTAGVAAAAGYAKSVIRTDAYGFQTADRETALMHDAAGKTEGRGLVTADLLPDGGFEEVAEQKRGTEEAYSGACENMEEIQGVRYSSYEAFREAETMPAALPDDSLLESEISSQEYFTLGDDFLLVRIETPGHLFMLDQSYYGNSEGHASTTVYPEGVCNERSYTTVQGFTYTVIDSVCEEGETAGIHAAVSVGDYELIVDFSGYTEEEAYRILDDMDLTVYLEEK